MTQTLQAVSTGLAEGQFRLFYQPLIAAYSRQMRGAEALIRWQHPERGLLAPDAFLPAIEQHELMSDVTDWVVRTAARDAVRWDDAGSTVPISVNLSATLLTDEELAARVLGIVSEEGLPSSLLTLEVTETALAEDPQTARHAFASLRARDVRISIDDFGTGYTSLAALRDHNFDELKIDRSFVARVRESPADQAVVRAVADLAHRLGLEVVAEGVEDETTARMLEQIGCDVLQGYCFARPQSHEQTTEWILAHDVARISTETSRRLPAVEASAGAAPPVRAGSAEEDEKRRLAAMDALDLADATRAQVLDEMVEIAVTHCETPMGMLNLLGADLEGLKNGERGISMADLPRQATFGAFAMEEPHEVFEVRDAAADPRFADNALVVGKPFIRFYAGAALVSDDGHPVGVLSVVDTRPRQLTDTQRELLQRLARVAVRHLEVSRSEGSLRRLCDVMSSLSRVRSITDIPTAAKLVTDAAQALLRADGVALSLAPAPGAVVFETTAQTVVDESQAQTGESVHLDSRTDPAAAEVLRTGQPLFVADAPGSPMLDQGLVKAFDVSSLFYVPIQADDSLFGVMIAWWRSPHPTLPERTRQRIEMLAMETATNLSRLYALATLREAADTDPLTGLLNRRTFTNALLRVPAGSTMVMLDIDRFKPVNDEGGHLAGDDVLRAFAAQLRAVTRTHDLVARWGGDEFALALPDLGIAGAEAMLRRLRHAWDRTPTFSSGYTVTTDAETAMSALHRADQALYGAKAAGRNEDVRS